MWSRKSDTGRNSELKTCVVKFRKYELINAASSALTDFSFIISPLLLSQHENTQAAVA